VTAALVVISLLPGSVFASGAWNFQHGNTSDMNLHGVWFADAMHGWAVGGSPGGRTDPGHTNLRTTDGGTTWISPTTDPAADTLNRVFFSDKTHGLAVGESGESNELPAAILRTSDGGDTWAQATGTVPHVALEAVYMFPDNLTAFAAGGELTDDGGNCVATLLKSTDGGATWSDLSANLPAVSLTNKYCVDAMWWVSTTEGWLGGNRKNPADSGLILHTTDGGGTWNAVDSHTSTNGYESMMFTDATHGWAVGDCKTTLAAGCTRGAISKWDGASWSDLSPPEAAGFDMQGVWFVDNTHGWAVADSNDPGADPARVILFSSDGGATWTVQPDNGPHPSPSPSVSPSVTPSPPPSSAVAGLTFVHAIDICHAWAVGGEGLILGFSDACPTPAASVAPVKLPKSGSPGSNGASNPAVLAAAVLGLGAIGLGGWALRRRSSS
jgi:photosystem II stability/assembly factor-like uncharacterized protein